MKIHWLNGTAYFGGQCMDGGCDGGIVRVSR